MNAKLKQIIKEEVEALNENTYRVYHGTNQEFDKFDFKRATQGIIWFTDSLESIKNQTHGGQGNKYIMTRDIVINNPAGWAEYEKYGLQQLEDMGYDGVILPQGDKNDYFVFSNKSIKKPKDIIKEENYQGSHQAPQPNGDDSPMYDVTKQFGEDIYGSNAVRMFGGYGSYDNYSIALIQQARNKPNMQVKIYRAVPKVITNQEKIDDYQKRMKYILKTGKLPRDVDNWRNSSEYYDWLSGEIEKLKTQPTEDRTKINNGDWVTINPQYAKEHGQGNLKNNFRVLTKTVSASQLYTDGNCIHEWGYSTEKAKPQGINEGQKFNIKSILNTDAAYQTLDSSSAGKSTWCAGGCAILAYALNILYQYPVYVIYDYDNNQIDHFIVKTPSNTFIDCEGEQQNILKNYRNREGLRDKSLKVLRYNENLTNNGIFIDMQASQKLAELVRNSVKYL